MPAERPIIRTTILLAGGNAHNVALLKEGLQQAHAHRVFVATTSSEVLSLVKNVHIDMLIFDDELFPLPGSELYQQLQGMKRLETLPVII
jgi:DNA-binding response OmpR family regulator